GVVWTNTLPIGRQTHVAVAYDFVAGTEILYVNGQRVSSTPVSIPLRAINDINDWFGRSNWPDPYFNGQLDELRIYNGVLADATIAASFAAGPNTLLRPSLGSFRSGNSVILTWPQDAAGYILESATNFLSGVIWSVVTNAP